VSFISSFKQQKNIQQQPIIVGLLLCGDVHLALQPEFGSYAKCLINEFQLQGKQVTIKTWQVWQNEIPDSIMEADVYVVSGSSASVFDNEPWIKRLSDFICRAHSKNRRLLGICFGHQMIHHALGGKVERAPVGWGLGIYPIKLYHKITGLSQYDSISLFAMHRDQVIVPADGFDLLGGNEFCPYYLLSQANGVFTLQGHPEFTRRFFNAFLTVAENKFDAHTVAKARLSMQKNDDSDVVCRLVNDFILNRL